LVQLFLDDVLVVENLVADHHFFHDVGLVDALELDFDAFGIFTLQIFGLVFV